MKVIAIVQARLGSIRYPNKVLQSLNNIRLIELLLKRLSCSKRINKIILATTDNEIDNKLADIVINLGFEVYRGSEKDVLDRFYKASINEKPDILVRITGDCPFVDYKIVDKVINQHINLNSDYTSNTHPPTFPDGFDVEVFNFNCLKEAWENSFKEYDREHVTPFIYNPNNNFKISNFLNKEDLSHLRLTIDEPIDFNVISNVFNSFNNRIDFDYDEIIDLYNNKPNIFMENLNLMRNEGSFLGTGQKLWKRAKKVIPGGNMLLSKRSEMFLPDYWPSYFSKANGCYIWDLDDKKLLDMTIMGIGTNTLGYGHQEVDNSVFECIKKGNMSTLNCPEEVYLAEKLIEINPWAQMVRFARTGGEANAIAIRIARAASGKDNVAICGYHGWHDWYLSANYNDASDLAQHLLPGLDPAGVPINLKNTVFPFQYNNFEELENIILTKNIGVIKMEVQRNFKPENNFLKKVRKIASEKNIVLIFDECTSGFRESFGGIFLKYEVEPDIAMFGKTIGNGYALTAVVGKREIMEAAQKTFISSTFWTERIGPVAALKTLEVMERIKSWEIITQKGKKMKDGLLNLADLHKLKINLSGLDSLLTYTFESNNKLKYKTFITQEMLKKGILASTNFYASIAHTEKEFDRYFNELDTIFKLISDCESDLKTIDDLLDGQICHDGFKRLN
jgi:glutamate-1-semialdehyde 2,1-aminomutase